MLKICLVALIYSVLIGLTAAHDDEAAGMRREHK